jgi:hypothetical protein
MRCFPSGRRLLSRRSDGPSGRRTQKRCRPSGLNRSGSWRISSGSPVPGPSAWASYTIQPRRLAESGNADGKRRAVRCCRAVLASPTRQNRAVDTLQVVFQRLEEHPAMASQQVTALQEELRKLQVRSQPASLDVNPGQGMGADHRPRAPDVDAPVAGWTRCPDQYSPRFALAVVSTGSAHPSGGSWASLACSSSGRCPLRRACA